MTGFTGVGRGVGVVTVGTGVGVAVGATEVWTGVGAMESVGVTTGGTVPPFFMSRNPPRMAAMTMTAITP
jgi:hypothetical protein